MKSQHVFAKTRSVCPVCLKPVNAYKTWEDGGVYLEKSCQEHGLFRTLIWRGDERSYLAWDKQQNESVPTACQTESKEGCPYDCGLCTDHRQQMCCVVLELTSRCNLRCPVCFASAGRKSQDPTLGEIGRWYDRLLEAGGPYNIQLSGGEPTMRDDLPEIIRMGKEKGFTFFQLNSNGLKLAEDPSLAKTLLDAGLNCVFLQFDGMSDEPYRILRGKPLLAQKLKAIEHCREAGLGVVLVPTVAPGVNMDEIGAILRFAFSSLPYVRGVHFQPASQFGRYELGRSEDRITIPDMLRAIETQTGGDLKAAEFTGGGAENSYCSFHGNFMLLPNGKIKAAPTQGGGCCCGSSSKQAREFVARKWSGGKKVRLVRQEVSKPRGIDSLDAFLEQMESYTLAVSGMLFQDAWTFDVDRVRSCYIIEVDPSGKMIPFCAYNLTSASGETLYRGKDLRERTEKKPAFSKPGV